MIKTYSIGSVSATLFCTLIANGQPTDSYYQDGVYELSTLQSSNGNDGIILRSTNPAQVTLGDWVSGVGDINGDGIEDFAVSADGETVGVIEEAGKIYILFGTSTPPANSVFHVDTLGPNSAIEGFIINGDGFKDFAGDRIVKAGDVNGDGFADFMINTDSGNSSSHLYVVFGSATIGSSGTMNLDDFPGELSNESASSIGFRQNAPFGHASYHFSDHIAGVGDVNGDGFDDILISEPDYEGHLDTNNDAQTGAAYLIYGRSDLSYTNLSGHTPGENWTLLQGRNNGNLFYYHFGLPVSAAGDFNNDGFDDIAIGTIESHFTGSHPVTYIVYGSSTISSMANINAYTMPTSERLRIIFDSDTASIGHSMSSLGDIDSDGYDDILISEHNSDNNSLNDSGSAHIIFGGLTQSDLHLESGLIAGESMLIDGLNSSDNLALSSSALGDLNNDGISDFVVGCQNCDPNGPQSGAAYVIFGDTNISNSTTLDLSNIQEFGFVIQGINNNDIASYSIGNAGDFNNDGFDDVVISSRGVAQHGIYNHVGEAYILLGQQGPCSSADFAPEYGQLDFFDVSAFLDLYTAEDPSADLDGDGSFTFFDANAFTQLFANGCP